MNNIADLYKPGYILIADSWENDRDYRDTNWMWFESEQNALSIVHVKSAEYEELDGVY